jgi:hypothetical protein
MKLRWSILLLGVVATDLAAQRPRRPHRSGLWGELGGGGGVARIACSGCTDVVTAGGITNHFRIGGTVSDRVVIGFETFGLLDQAFGFAPSDPSTGSSAETVSLAVVVLWFPGRRGLFFKGGVGAATGEFVLPTGAQSDTSQGGGMGVTFGVGWDWPISRKFAITANVGTYVTALGDIVLPGRRVDDVIATMYEASIGFTFR